ncbi:GMC family oxidoreductase [Burkholderia sp. D-99]|uniref:GMC family oxidoreductase n=1 Tax=Burkholderia sp. D-99 TaxID=2717316 RepID=UPI00141E4988|nr:GMC family oxidoreductase N-terminal domain-containing protein [Burkholderia sp. D-99]NHV24860.1 choline dehydrogenase [Burkholderia sp. D-99]
MLNIVSEPAIDGYDYVVVGSGSAGSTVAGRLAENPSLRILLIEVGGSDINLGIVMPGAMGLPLLSDKTNWKLFSDDYPERIYEPRGRVLGGSSSVNGMNWMRGNAEDYDGWSNLGVAGWEYKDVLPFFKKTETFEDGENLWRGGSGPIKVERAQCRNRLFEAFLEAGQQAGHALNPDHNGEKQAGMHRIQRNIGNGRRMNASYAYLRQHPMPNLDVMLHTRVTRLLFSGTTCVAVEATRLNRNHRISVGREAILCAGALMSPQLLMLSGIGDANELRKHRISPVAHHPEVGQGLSDHTALVIDWHVRNEHDSMARELSLPRRPIIGAQWILTRRGLGASNLFEAGAMISTDGSGRPDIQMECVAFRPYFGHDAIRINPGYHCSLSLQRPTSVGRVWLHSADPLAMPAFSFDYLTSEHDKRLAIKAVKNMREIMSQPAIAKMILGEAGDVSKARSDAEILAWAKATAESNYHPSCTLRMGKVTDSEGRVIGIERVRVVDASIFPTIPSANLNSPVIMLAEKISSSMLHGTRQAIPGQLKSFSVNTA